tara:strand:- start:3093 stop:4289 length:1197 start_codon:yes stop_codon:yes gene_type:complete
MTISFLNLKNSNGKVTFEIKSDQNNPIDISVINGIRRTILNDVPTVGIPQEQILIEKNETSLHNEFMKHRISMIPLYIDPLKYNNDYLFVLHVENKTDAPITITTEDFKIHPLKKELQNKSDLAINMENYDMNIEISEKLKQDILRPFKIDTIISYIIITELKNKTSYNEYQTFKCNFIPKIGTGKQNTLFNNIAQCSYNYRENKKALKDAIQEELKIKSIDSELDKKIFQKEFTNSYSQRYYYRNYDNIPYWFDFVIKSNHYFKSGKCFEIALEILIDKLNLCSNNFKLINLDSDKSRYSIEIKNKQLYFMLNDENDTIGNILQSHISNNINEKSIITCCGYKKTHPLEEVIKLIISHKMLDEIDDATIISKVIFSICENIDEIINILQEMLKKYKK